MPRKRRTRATTHTRKIEGKRASPRTGGRAGIRTVTERKRAEQAIRESEERYRQLVETSPEAIVVHSEGKLVFLNPAALKLLGATSAEQLIGQPIIERVHPDFRAVSRQRIAAAGTGERIPLLEEKLLRLDGSVFYAELGVSKITFNGKEALQVALRDTTERKQAEEARKASEERYQMLFENAQDGIAVADIASGTLMNCNPALCRMVERNKTELVGQSQSILHPPQKLAHGQTLKFRQALTGKASEGTEDHLLSKSGKLIPVEILVSRIWINGRDCLLGIFRDTTERKRAEEALRKSEEQYRNIVEQSMMGIGISRGNQVIFANRALMRIFNYDDPEEFQKIPLMDHVAPSSRKLIGDRMKMIAEGKIPPPEFEYDILCKGGLTKTLRAYSAHLSMGGENYAQTLFQDITEQKRAVEALSHEQSLLRALMDNVPDNVYFKDRDSRFLAVSRAKARRHGREPADLIGKTDFDFFSEEHARQAYIDEQRMMRTGEPLIGHEEKETWPDGHVTWVYTTKVPLRDANGTITGMVGISRDITERKQAMEELGTSEERLSLALEGSTDGFWDWNIPTGKAFFGARYYTMLGYEPGEFPASYESFLSLMHPDDRAGTEEAFRQHLEHKLPSYALEFRLRTKAGDYHWILSRGKVVERDAEGKAVRMAGTHSDITERKQAEEALRQEQTLFNSLASTIPDNIYFKDRQSRFVRINDAMAKWFGIRDSGEAAGKTDFDFFSEEHARQAYEDEQRIMRTGEPLIGLEEKETWPDGRVTWASTTKVPLRDANGTITGMVGISRDITERKRAEQALGESEARFRTLVEHAPEAVFVGTLGDAENIPRFTYLNTSAVELFGAPSADALIGQPVMDRIHPDWRDAVRQDMRVLQERDFVRTAEINYLRLDGTPVAVELTVANITFQGHKGAVIFARNITERKKTETLIREQAALLDHANDAIYVTSLDCTILYWNKAAERIYGWSSAEAVNRRTAELISPDAAAVADLLAKVLQQGDWSGEWQQMTKAGRLVDVLCRLTLMRDELGRPRTILAINTDITEKKKLEAQFLRAQRLESLGALASGIAHDLNNVLAPIVMGAQLLRESVHDNMGRSLLETMEKSAKRGADIVQQVLTFARGSAGLRVSLQLRHLLREMVAIAEETFPKNIKIATEMPDDIWPIEGDPTQLHQALMNLCVNARDAMPEGGTLTLAAANVTVDEAAAAQTPGATPGRFVRLRVTDTGSGIPPDVAARLFEPFFTTKGVGKGTGLGLSTVLGILKSHRGFIRLDTQMGRGTTFELYFPTTPAAVEVADAPPGTSRPWPRAGGELVMLVDDEAPVREVARQALEEFGYRVITCAAGAEAIKQFNAACGGVQLVVTDMMMPEMDGPTLVKALRAIEPGIRIVGITGVADTATMHRLRALALAAMLTKPFTVGQLLTTVRDAQSTPTGRAPPPPA